MAGLTAAAVVIPKAMAYATIAGLPVQVAEMVTAAAALVTMLFNLERAVEAFQGRSGSTRQGEEDTAKIGG